MNKPHDHRYEFGEFQLDPTERVLFHQGEHVRLQPKTFETLLALLEQAGHVVRKEELMARVWPDAFVEEINLTKNISTLRKTLRNGNGAGEFIETIPTVGYRFVAEVRQVENGDRMNGRNGDAALGAERVASSAEAPPKVSPAPSPRPLFSRRRQWRWYGWALLLIFGVSLAWFRWLPPRQEPLSARDEFAPVRLTRHSARDFSPAYSPDGNKIAFASNRDGLPAIYVMNADGSDVRKVSGDALNCHLLYWVADGTKLLFTARDATGKTIGYEVSADGSGLAQLPTPYIHRSPDGKKTLFVKELIPGFAASIEIFVANADGSNELRLTNNHTLDVDDCWAPDGQRIAFTCFPDGFVYGETGNAEICAVDADSKNWVRLTNDPANDWNPSWSPDGTRIAFLSTRHCQDSEAIYVMNADGSNALPLTECQRLDGTPGWSPDSKRLAYASNREGNAEIYSINADPSRQTNITNHLAEDEEPVWSRDGKKIAFLSNREGKKSLYVMDANGGNQRKLAPRLSNIMGWLRWSPDGRRITFVANWAGNPDIYVANDDGSNIVQLTNSPATESQPVWSPDGAKILFASDVSTFHQIFLMNADGSGVTQISHSSENEGLHDWSPDGKQIIFTRSRNRGVQRDIWMMDADGSNPRLIAFAPSTDELLFPRFSPDGQRIAFHRRVALPLQADVWVMNADGNRQTRLTYLGGGLPVWSPDGKKLAFQSQKRTGNNEIYVMTVK